MDNSDGGPVRLDRVVHQIIEGLAGGVLRTDQPRDDDAEERAFPAPSPVSGSRCLGLVVGHEPANLLRGLQCGSAARSQALDVVRVVDH